jgi:hypothetical protein
MKLSVQRKKVTLHEIAAPKPSPAAARVVRSALKGAYKDQQAVLKKAYSTK